MAYQEDALEVTVRILLESLEQKEELLSRVEKQTENQEELLKTENFEVKEWDTLVEEKAKLIEKINHIDSGFETFYEKNRLDLMKNREKFSEQLHSMQLLIQKIMGKSASIQALEERNRLTVEHSVHGEKKQLVLNKSASYVANSYNNTKRNKAGAVTQTFDAKK